MRSGIGAGTGTELKRPSTVVLAKSELFFEFGMSTMVDKDCAEVGQDFLEPATIFQNEPNRTHFSDNRSQLGTRWQSLTKRRSGFLFSYLRGGEQPIPKNGRLTKRTQIGPQ